MTLKNLQILTGLFAITVNKSDDKDKSKVLEIFKSFLDKTIEAKHIASIIELFESNLSEYASENSNKKLTKNSVKLIAFCEKLAYDLSSTERFTLIFYLLILIRDIGAERQSIEFIDTVAKIFEIDSLSFEEISNFMLYDDINNAKPILNSEQIIAFILKTKYNLIVLKTVSEEVRINSKKNNIDEFSLIDKDSILEFANNKLFFNEIISFFHTKETDDCNFSLLLNDIEIKTKTKKLLHRFSIEINKSEFVGVIGNSGSGKSTFLKAAAGFDNRLLQKPSLIKNEKLVHNYKSSFVDQHNAFLPYYTVLEHMQHRCDFLQYDKTKSVKLIEKVLLDVNLTDDINKVVIDHNFNPVHLSGGQMKRLSIAMELLCDNDVIILDEPTSGLSSLDSTKIISMLKQLTISGKIIIISVHQPDFDSFKMFDKLLIIDDGGYPVYYNSPLKAADYFRDISNRVDKSSLIEFANDPGVIFRLLAQSKDTSIKDSENDKELCSKKLYDLFLDTTDNDKNINIKELENNKTKRKFFKSLGHSLRFTIINETKQIKRIIVLLAVPFLAGLFFAMISKYSETETYNLYNNPNIPAVILIILITAVFIGLVSSANEFISTRNFVLFENRIANIYFARTFASIIKFMVLALIQTALLIVPLLLILKMEYFTISLFAYLYILIVWGNLAGLILSSIFPNIGTIYLVIPLIIIPQMIFSGALIKYEHLNSYLNKKYDVPIIADLIPIRWATEGIITDMYLNNPYKQKILKYDRAIANYNYYLNYFIPEIEELDSKNDNFAINLAQIELAYLFEKNIEFQSIEQLKNISKIIRAEITKLENERDSVISLETIKIIDLKINYTNKGIDKIIQDNSFGKTIEFSENKFKRLYKTIYSYQSTSSNNRVFLTGYKKLFGSETSTFTYNLFACFIYNILLTLGLLVVKNLE